MSEMASGEPVNPTYCLSNRSQSTLEPGKDRDSLGDRASLDTSHACQHFVHLSIPVLSLYSSGTHCVHRLELDWQLLPGTTLYHLDEPI